MPQPALATLAPAPGGPALPLQRQRLVWLNAGAWLRLLAVDPAATDAQAMGCLRHWARHDLPLVVTRQPARWQGRADDALALGLPAPARWGQRRLFVDAHVSEVRRCGDFPLARVVMPLLDPRWHENWAAVCDGLDSIGTPARVYGSHGWQQLTGLRCLRAGSDIDLLVAVASPGQADAAVARLQAVAGDLPRLDGELVFADGAAVAWREWAAWRAGRSRRVLVKTVHGAALAPPDAWRAAA